MRCIHLIAICMLLVFGQAAAYTLQPGEIGVFADPGGTQILKKSEADSPFPVYLVANIDDPSGLRAFEVRVTSGDNVKIEGWTLEDPGAVNMAVNIPQDPDDPYNGWELQENFAAAFPNAQAPGIRVLATGTCTLLRNQVGFVYIELDENSTCSDIPLYYHPGDLSRIDEPKPFTSTAAAFDEPVFTINNCTPPGEWSEFAGIENPPPPLGGYAMAFNKEDGTGLMFGGTYYRDEDDVHTYYDTTYEWVNGDWFEIEGLNPRPSKRRRSGMAYDSGRNKYVLFGGHDDRGHPDGLLDDTWEFDCETRTWEEVTTAYPAPTRRAYMAFAYDSADEECVVYGGVAPTGRFDDSWRYDCSTRSWSRICDDCTPGYVAYSAMAYDEENDMMVMFGGESPSTYLDETHTYSGGSDWVEVIAPGPSARIFLAMAYHVGCGGVYLHGGMLGPISYADDTWVFQGGVWEEVVEKKAIGPGPRASHVMVYDTDHTGFMFFGGENETGILNDTWFHGELLDYETPVDPGEDVPVFNGIHTNYPNPFNPQTTIHFKMKRSGPVKLTVYDLHGRPVKTLVDDVREAGEYDTVWNAEDSSGARVASGVYAYRLVLGSEVHVGKMAVLK